MVILEQFSIDHLKYRETSGFGPRNPNYLIKPNELLEHFKSLRILYYEDTVVELDEGNAQRNGGGHSTHRRESGIVVEQHTHFDINAVQSLIGGSK